MKFIIASVVVFLVVGVMAVGLAETFPAEVPSFTAVDDLNTHVQSGFPLFVDPFVNPFDDIGPLSSYTFLPTYLTNGELGGAGVNTFDVSGCTSSDASSCIRDFNGTDSNESFAIIRDSGISNPPGPCGVGECKELQFDLEGSSLLGQTLIEFTLDIWCRSANVTTPLEAQVAGLHQWNDGFAGYVVIADPSLNRVVCPIGTEFVQRVMRIGGGGIVFDTGAEDNRLTVDLNAAKGGLADDALEISTARFHGVYKVTGTTCGGWDIPCALGQIWETASKVVAFILNGIAFLVNGIVFLVASAAYIFITLGKAVAVPILGAAWILGVFPSPINLLVGGVTALFLVGSIIDVVRMVRGPGGPI